MEEVDSIILHFLRRLDVNIDDEIKKLNDLSVDTIIYSVSECLHTINPHLKVPKYLPQGVSHRIEVAAQLASMCKDLGYKNEVGYQTFLYYNEADLRQVFMFLIECLPTEGKQLKITTEYDENTLLYKNISRKIEKEMNSIWIPFCCISKQYDKTGHSFSTDKLKTTCISSMVIDSETLLGKLLKIKENNLETKLLKTELSNVLIHSEIADDDLKNHIEIDSPKTLIELKEEVILLKQKITTYENERNSLNAEYSKIKKSCELAEEELKTIQNILQNIAINEDDELVDVIKKMKYNINLLHVKSEELTSKNLSLKTEIDKLKMNLPQSQKSTCRRTLTSLKETAKAMKEDYNSKQELNKNLQVHFNKLNKGSKRHIYTKRILEIISNVDKQNIEIKKVLEDTRHLQKEINTLEGQLDRCFSVADETLFKDAKKDDQAKKAYKLLALLHSECNTIVTLVNDTGTLAREIIDLEDHVKAEKTKRTEETLKRIQSDISKMKEEL